MRWLLAIALVLGGCRQLFDLRDLPPADAVDAPPDVLVLPDAGMCPAVSTECVAPTVLRACTVIGQLPIDITCSWGCATTGAAHCARLQPVGGGVIPTDLDLTTGLSSTTLLATTLNSDDGSILGFRAAGIGIVSGIEFEVRGGVGVFRFAGLVVSGVLTLRGSHAIALVSTSDITVSAAVDARGDCLNTDAGPGGRAGGAQATTAAGAGGGTNGTGAQGDCSAGGGGGDGAVGGVGGKNVGANPAGGPVVGNAVITTLIGGGGGGGGGSNRGATGGGGGGALQLVANGVITIASTINAGGCGGHGGGADFGGANGGGGGGGGAGGVVLLEAPTIHLQSSTILAVNGGGGGGGDLGLSGAAGSLSTTRSAGGMSQGGQGGDGGRGGASGALAGEAGVDALIGGGGGGGVGWIRIETLSGAAIINLGAILSPTLPEVASTTTQGVAVTQ